MSTVLRQGATNREAAPGTLGALLYADRGKPRITETEWARLVVGIARQDAAALRALYDRANRIVFTLAFRICGSHETAEEITVDVFHDIWRKAESYDPAAGTVVAWIMNQARSRALDRLRHDRRKKRVDPHTHDAHADDATVAIGEDEALDRAAAGRALRGALTALTADERLAIETAYFGDMSYSEAALRLQQPVGTVKTRIRSALAKLRQALEGKS